MSAPYYTGDTVPLKFTVGDDSGAINPSGINISILMPDNTIDDTVNGDILNDTVSCTIPASITDQVGKYKVYFVLELPGSLIRTHIIEFETRRNPERWLG